MKIAISYPPIINALGQKAMVSQNRNVQYFKKPTYLLPVIHAQAATWLNEKGYEVIWDDGNAQLKEYGKWLEALVEAKPNIVVFKFHKLSQSKINSSVKKFRLTRYSLPMIILPFKPIILITVSMNALFNAFDYKIVVQTFV
jgi:hypothetical protein